MFQFTRPQGARLPQHRYNLQDQEFQFTRPQGARLAAFSLSRADGTVSIHAPARGATIASCAAPAKAKVSIHAPARGATFVQNALLFAVTFQFTRPQGARLQPVTLMPSIASFNSRARKGRDVANGFTPASISRFNSRARKGRDKRGPVRTDVARPFQFTRPQGARLSQLPVT